MEKVALTAEISATYLQVRRRLRNRDMAVVVAGIRERAGQPQGTDLRFAGRLGAIVDARLELLPGDTRCLVRSLVLLSMLARRGLRGTVVIGVRTAPEFGAHAWVELDGVPLLQPIEPGGQRLTEL